MNKEAISECLPNFVARIILTRMKSNSLGSSKIRGVLDLVRLCKLRSMVKPSESGVVVATARRRLGDNDNGFGNMQLTGLKFVPATAFGAGAGVSASSSGEMGSDAAPTPPAALPKPPTPRPPSPPRRGRFPMWIMDDYFGRTKLVIGSVFSLLLAFWTPNLPTLLKLGGETEVVIKEAGQAAAVVEKVAAVVEKVAEDVADNLPEGNKFKDTALIVELVSKEAAKDAHLAEQILNKLEDVEQIIEPIIDVNENDDNSNKANKS